jgi:hypothetical protein
MARARMLNQKIVRDKAVNDLPDDTARLLFTWMIPHLDRDGRMPGDPLLVKNMIFPRRADITTENVARYLRAMHEVGLIIWHSAEGDYFISFPGFAKNQPGMRYDREAESDYPAPPKAPCDPPSWPDASGNIAGVSPELVRSDAGVSPEASGHIAGVVRPNRREVNGMESNDAPAAAAPLEISPGEQLAQTLGLLSADGKVNVTAVVVRLAKELYPERAWDGSAFGRAGKVIQALGGGREGAQEVARRLVDALPYKPEGDLWSYIQEMGDNPGRDYLERLKIA